MRVAGIDGYNGGWVAVVVDSGDFSKAETKWESSLQELIDIGNIELSLVDIPVGLSTGPEDREVENTIRTFLTGKASSVFNSPCRQALSGQSYEEASEINKQILGKGLSKQSWSLFPKIQEADLVAQNPSNGSVKEGHPEVSFAVVNNSPILASKKSAKGMLERVSVLSDLGFDFSGLAGNLPDRHSAAPDDLLDAAILAWSANRVINNQHISFPNAPRRDECGLEMAVFA